MKKIFTLKRSGKDRGEEIQDISLDILLAHKDDVMTKVETENKYQLLIVLSVKEWVQDISHKKVGDWEWACRGWKAWAFLKV